MGDQRAPWEFWPPLAGSEATMSDRDDWVTFLDRFGIHWNAPEDIGGGGTPPNDIVIPSEGGDSNTGHPWFYAAVEFDVDGNFIRIGIWE